MLLSQICKHIHHLPVIGPNLAWLAMTEPAVDLSGRRQFFQLRLCSKGDTLDLTTSVVLYWSKVRWLDW